MSHGARPFIINNVIIFKSNTPVSDTSVHVDYYLAQLTKLKIAAGQKQAETSFHNQQSGSKYDHLCHANIITSSAIGLVISNPRLAPPHVIRILLRTPDMALQIVISIHGIASYYLIGQLSPMHNRYFHVNFGFNTYLFDWLHGTLRRPDREYGEDIFGGKGRKKED